MRRVLEVLMISGDDAEKAKGERYSFISTDG